MTVCDRSNQNLKANLTATTTSAQSANLETMPPHTLQAVVIANQINAIGYLRGSFERKVWKVLMKYRVRAAAQTP